MKVPHLKDPEAAEVVEAVRRINAVLGHARLYGTQHRMTASSAASAFEAVTKLVWEQGVLELHPAIDGIHWRGVNVHIEDAEDGLGFGRMLHREGIESVTFYPEVSIDALLAFLEVLRANLSLPTFEEESLSLLLWQAKLKGIGFRSISSLKDAELFSARMSSPEGEADDLADLFEGEAETLGTQASAVAGAHRAWVEDERPAIFESPGKAGKVESPAAVAEAEGPCDTTDIEDLGGDLGADVDAEEWDRQLAREASEDAAVIEKMRHEVETERESDLLARLSIFLFQVAAVRRSEFPSDEATRRARDALEEIYRRRDPVGLMHLLRESQHLERDPAVAERPGAEDARAFIERALQPMRVARLLAAIDPSNPATSAAAESLLSRLPDDALQAMLEWAARGQNRDRIRRLMETVSQIVGERLQSWLAEAHRQPAERLLPIVAILRAWGAGQGRFHRLRLLRHPSPLVREAAVRWYEDDLPEEELEAVLPMQLDHDETVRRSAAAVLRSRSQPASLSWFLGALEDPRFQRLSHDSRMSFFFTFGAVVGEEAVIPLAERLNRHLPWVFDEPVVQRLREAAHGLAATRTPLAQKCLRQGARSLRSAKRTACRVALKQFEGEA